MTVAVRQYEIAVPYGVIETDGVFISAISEKPVVRHLINAGIYILSPEACKYIPYGKHFDMTELIQLLLQKGCGVVSFPIVEYWMDIGQKVDYQQAKEDVENGRWTL